MYVPEMVAYDGNADGWAQTRTVRWGDYSAMVVDPIDWLLFFAIAIYPFLLIWQGGDLTDTEFHATHSQNFFSDLNEGNVKSMTVLAYFIGSAINGCPCSRANAVVATVELQVLNATANNGDIVIVAGRLSSSVSMLLETLQASLIRKMRLNW